MNIAEIVAAANAVEGWMSMEELGWLAVQAKARSAIVEIGSWKGRSTKALALATDGIVVAVDHWLGSEGERATSYKEAADRGQLGMLAVFMTNLNVELEAGKVLPIVGKSSDILGDVRTVLLARGIQRIDMLFIDGDHSYASVKSDIETYVPLVKPGGLICGHDYSSGCMAVVQAVHDTIGKPASVVGSIWSVTAGY